MSSADPFFVDPDKLLAHEQKVQRLLELRAEGIGYKAACATMRAEGHDITERTALRMVQDAARLVREQIREHCESRMLEMDSRCEWLYAHCAAQIKRSLATGVLDDKAVRVAVAVLERQAKLLGLDVKGPQGGRSVAEWASDAPLDMVVRLAREMGMDIPESFKC